MRVVAYSKALYANWFYVEPLRLLLDAGEGANNLLEGRLLAVQDLLLTHGHTDHYTGLHSIVGFRVREVLRHGHEVEPLQIYYPAGSGTLRRYLTFLSENVPLWEQLVEEHPLEPGDEALLSSREDMVLMALEQEHMLQEPCLGYCLSQLRWKLRPEFRQLPGEEIRERMAREGREALSEQVKFPLLLYSGDGRPLYDPGAHQPEVLIHEATFLDPDSSPGHSSLSEALEVYRQLEARHLLLAHFSTRYTHEEIQEALAQQTPPLSPRQTIQPILPGELFRVDLDVSGM